MSCQNNHATCVGPLCTVNSSPKRALQGAAKDRKAIMDSFKEKVYGYRDKESATSLTLRYSRLELATSALSMARDIVYHSSTWSLQYSLWNVGLETFVRLTLKKVKV